MSGEAPGGFPGGAGFPPGMMGGMNMEMLQSFMNDPNIRRMTEAIAQDPVFAEMAKEMQEAMLSGDMGNLGLSSEDAGDAQGRAAAAPGMPPMPGMPGINPAKYMEAMQRVMQNTEFMAAAESLGRGLMSQSMDPQSLAMLELFQNPANQEALRKRLEDLKEDPELSEVLKDIEENGQSALMKYMNEPEIMAKVGRRFQEALDDPEFRAQLEGGNAIKGGEEEEEDEDTIISVAAAGDVEALKKLLSEGAAVDEKDDEDRTALHFTAGYDEIECMKVLLEAGAKIDALDSSKNTPLHFAAGYGNIEATRLLLEKGADVSAVNEDGKTAAQVAELNEHAEVAGLFTKISREG